MTHEAESELVARLRRHKGSGFNKCQDAADRIQELEAQIADYEKVLGDKRRLAREIDVAMHGEEGAAQQASLCDLVTPAKRLREQLSGVHAGTHCIVPVEPTEEMLLALYGSYLSDELSKRSCRGAYKSMISATKETG